MPNQLINCVFQAEICLGYKSDHSRITLTLKLSSLARGRGLWQLNETYLSNQDYVNMINNSIDEFLENNAELSPTLKWDMIKMNLREKSISFTVLSACSYVPKDKDPILKKSGVIYRFKCNRVECDEEYIGESARNFGERYKEHQKAPSPIHDHFNISGHTVSIDDFSILARGRPKPPQNNQRSHLHQG